MERDHRATAPTTTISASSIVTGNGRAFSSGVDLSVLGSDKNPAALPLLLPPEPHGLRQSRGAGEAGHRGDQRPLLRRRRRVGAVVRHPVRSGRREILPDRKSHRLHSGERRLQPHDPLRRPRQDQGDGDLRRADRRERSVAHRPGQSRRAGRRICSRKSMPMPTTWRPRRRSPWAWPSTHQSLPQHRHAYRPLPRALGPERAGAVRGSQGGHECVLPRSESRKFKGK